MKLRSIIALLGISGSLAAQDAAESRRAALAAVVLDQVKYEARPLGEVVAAIDRQIQAKLPAPMPLRLDLGLAGEEPRVTCSLVHENADTVLEFITLTSGFSWRIEENAIVVFTTNRHQAKWKRGVRVPARVPLRQLTLPRMAFTERPVTEIFLALGRLARERGLERLMEGLPRLEFSQKFVEDPAQGPNLTVTFDGCSLDDALELLTIRAPGFQWTIFQGAVVAFAGAGAS